MPPFESVSLTLRLQITFVAATALLIWRLFRIYRGKALQQLAIGWTLWMVRIGLAIAGALALQANVPAHVPGRRLLTAAAMIVAVSSACFIRAGTLTVAGIGAPESPWRCTKLWAMPMGLLALLTTYEGVPGWWRVALLLFSSTLVPLMLFSSLIWYLLRAPKDDLTTGRQLAAMTYVVFAAKQVYNAVAYVKGGAPSASPSAYSDTVVYALVAMGTVAMLLERERQRAVQAEREQRRLEGELAVRDRLDSLGRLAGGVAHDFNNMLTAILGNAQIARSRMDEVPDRDPSLDFTEELANIEVTATRASALTKQLLAFARRDRVAMVVFDMAVSVERVRKFLAPQLPPSVQFTVHLAQAPLYVSGDPDRLEQAIINLVKNAEDALHGATGSITVSLEPVRDGTDDRDMVQLVVRDTGAGMTEEVRSHLFEPFFTTKGQDRGTGLGLSIVHGAVMQAEGRIDVESAPGAGTSIRIRLPRAEAPAGHPSSELPSFTEMQGVRVLVVDDDPLVRRVAVRVLQKHGLRVIDASDVDEAIATYESRSGEEAVQLLLTDLVMPGANGRTLARMLRARDPELRVAYMSGYEADTFTDEPDAPDGAFLAKPFTEARLMTVVRDAMVAVPSGADAG